MNQARVGRILCLTLASCMAVSSVTADAKNSKTLPLADAIHQVLIATAWGVRRHALRGSNAVIIKVSFDMNFISEGECAQALLGSPFFCGRYTPRFPSGALRPSDHPRKA